MIGRKDRPIGIEWRGSPDQAWPAEAEPIRQTASPRPLAALVLTVADGRTPKLACIEKWWCQSPRLPALPARLPCLRACVHACVVPMAGSGPSRPLACCAALCSALPCTPVSAHGRAENTYQIGGTFSRSVGGCGPAPSL